DHLETPAGGLNVIAGAHERPGHKPAPGKLTIIAGPLAQPGPMNRPSLALQDHPVDRTELAERRQADIADFGPQLLQRAGDVFEPGCDLWISLQVALVKMADEAN